MNLPSSQKLLREKAHLEKGLSKKMFFENTVGASFQCYWDELMLLKCQINTNMEKMDFCFLQNVKEGVLKHSEILILGFNYFRKTIYVCGFLKLISEFYNIWIDSLWSNQE